VPVGACVSVWKAPLTEVSTSSSLSCLCAQDVLTYLEAHPDLAQKAVAKFSQSPSQGSGSASRQPQSQHARRGYDVEEEDDYLDAGPSTGAASAAVSTAKRGAHQRGTSAPATIDRYDSGDRTFSAQPVAPPPMASSGVAPVIVHPGTRARPRCCAPSSSSEALQPWHSTALTRVVAVCPRICW
jgi:hypothetical protein